MKILSVHLFSLASKEPVILSSAFEVQFVSFFQRGAVKEFLNFHSRLVASKASSNQHLQIKLEKGICYVVATSEKICGTMICDEEYPQRVAIELLVNLTEEFIKVKNQKNINLAEYTKDTEINMPYIQTIIKDWQNPSEKDTILKLQGQLSEVQDIMKQNINELLKREENLESLMEKSKDLSASSVTYYKTAKKTNSCCNL